MSSSYRNSLNQWLSQLDVVGNRVLDCGGSQLPVKSRTKSWDVNEYLIADLPEPHVGSPKPDIELDIEKSNAFAPYTDIGDGEIIHDNPHYEWADLIFCLEVFDYILEPVKAMKNLASYLKPGGILWATYPFAYPTHNPIEFDMLRYTEFAVRRLAKESELKIEQIIPRRPETDAVEQLWRRERMRAAKGYDHDVTGWIVRMSKNE